MAPPPSATALLFWDIQFVTVGSLQFARSDSPGAPLPVLLGLEFFLAHLAALQLPPPPQQGLIEVP
jgi:hypothetical protein